MHTSRSPLVLCAESNGVLRLSFNCPQRRNALNGEMYRELARLIFAAGSDPQVKALMVDGTSGYFTAGNDLDEFVGTPTELSAMVLFHALAKCEKPIVVSVEGGAVGIGVTMLLHCDFVYAGASTKFVAPFIKLGLSPEGASSLLLPITAGYKRAAQILLLGDAFTAQTAYDAGIITAVVTDGTACDQALHTCQRLAALPSEALQACKRLMKHPLEALVKVTFDTEEAAFLELLAKEPAQLAIAAFGKGRIR